MADDLSGRTLGQFVLREHLDMGGGGDVYRSSQPKLKRDVVVKVLREPHRSSVIAKERFLREAQLAARLDNIYAAHVYDFGVEAVDGLMWIAMELVHGITLDKWLRERGPLTLAQLVPLFECLAEVVHAAHACGIVHRDIKPANVMVMEHGIRLIPKLLDFGVAKMSREDESSRPDVWPEGSLGENQNPFEGHGPSGAVTGTDPTLKGRHLTPVGAGIGSWWYMAPEQWGDARAVGPASDIYSLGILAYKALTGRVPFPAQGEHECYQQHLNASVPRLGGDLPPDLDGIFQRALAKDPNARHGTALELASELRAALMASERELLRSLAHQWEACARRPDLLLGGDTLAGVERWTRQAPPGALSKLECSYVAASQRRARRSARIRRLLFAATLAIALGVVATWSVLRTRMADEFVTQAEVERGQQALLHGESSEAVLHLQRAYQRGDHSPGVAFMLARALQPRMSELVRFTSKSGRMWSATFAPDGKRVLTTDDKSARMWDAQSGQLLFEMSHGDAVYGAVFSPDKSRVLTVGGDGTVRIWNAATGASIRELKYQGAALTKWSYYAVAMSSRVVAAVDVTGKAVHVWEADTGKQIAELANDGAEMQLLAFSADGHWLATSGRDEVRVFETSTWRREATITGPRVRSLAFDPTGPRLAVGTGDGVASIWEIPSGVLIRALRGGGASIDAVAFSRDGVLVATASRDGAEQVWDAASGGLRTHLKSHHDMIYAVEFSATGDLLLSAGADGAVVVSNVATGMAIARLEGPKGRVLVAHFDPESRRVVGASWDGTARVWDATSPYRRWAAPQVGAECDTVESLVPDRRFIALSCRDNGTHVWDTSRGELLAELPSVSTVEGDYFSALPALTVTGDRAAIARGNTVEIYALPSGQLLHTVVHSAAVNAVGFSPSGHDLASGAVDGSLLLTLGDGKPIALPRSPAGVDAVAILTDGSVVAADASNRLRVIGRENHALLMDVAAPSRIRSLRSSPDGKRLVTISTRSAQAPLVLWDIDQRRPLARLEGHVGRVFTARFVDLGGEQQILTAGSDGTARLWDAATGRLRQIFRGDSHSLADAALSPDGSTIVAGGSDGLLRFWDTSNGRLLWTLQAHSSYIIGVHYEGSELVTRSRAGDVARWAFPPPDATIGACRARTCAPPTMAEK